MKSISVTDLVLIPELSHLRTLDFIDPKNAELIAPWLKLVGIDLDYPVQFIASQHRNLQGKVVISYQIVGEIEQNESFLRSPFATAEDRLIAAGYRDLSLAQEMANSMTVSMRYGDEEANNEGFPADQANPDEQDILTQIKQLNDMLDIVRGSQHKSDGNLLMFGEQGELKKSHK